MEVKGKNRIIKYYPSEGKNLDQKTVDAFGEEWTKFHSFSEQEIQKLGDKYFDIVSSEMLNKSSNVVDIGCGSGRFIKYLRNKCGHITGIDPSSAIFVADELIGADNKVTLIQASTDNIPFQDNYFDFGYSLGVLHHIPDTQKALNDCVNKIKPGGYFLLYLYYNLDNRSFFYRGLFSLSNGFRYVISRLPSKAKKTTCDILAIIFYMPFVVFSRVLKVLGVPLRIRKKIPLHGYEDQSFYVIRNDSLDRFGTPLEQRYSRAQIAEMMQRSGLSNIIFSEEIPYWHAVGQKK